MDNYTNNQFNYYGGNMSPSDYREEKLQAQKNEKRALFKSAAFLGLLLIMYNLLNEVYLDLYYALTYLKCEGSFSLDIDEVLEYLREEQQELVTSTSFLMTGNLFIVILSALTVFITAQFIMKIRITDMLQPYKGCVRDGAMWTPLALTVNMLLSIVASMIVLMLNQSGINVPEADFSIKQPSAYALIMQFIYVCLIGPVIEELIYRGLIIKLLTPFGKGLAAFFSALIFGLMHGNISQALTAFAGGLIYAMVAVRYDSIIPTIVIHIINNVASSIPDFGDAVGKNTNTLYLGILIIMLFLGFYMLIVRLRGLGREIAGSEHQYALPASKRTAAVFFNVFMLVYFVFFVLVKFIDRFMRIN